jgi:hypothetical protein
VAGMFTFISRNWISALLYDDSIADTLWLPTNQLEDEEKHRLQHTPISFKISLRILHPHEQQMHIKKIIEALLLYHIRERIICTSSSYLTILNV